jgi:hypothetical protein
MWGISGKMVNIPHHYGNIYGEYMVNIPITCPYMFFSQQLDFQKKTRDAHLGMLVRSLSQSNLPIAAIAAPKNGHDQNY